MRATFAHLSTVSPPRLTRQFQRASDPGLHHPPVLCCWETNLLPSLNAFVFSLYEKYPILCNLSSRNVAWQGFPTSRKTPGPLPHPAMPKSSYIIMQHYLLLSRNLLYTGLTRAKQLAVLVGPAKAIGLAVKRVTNQQRYTALADRMKSSTAPPNPKRHGPQVHNVSYSISLTMNY